MRDPFINRLREPFVEYLRDAEDAARGCPGACVERYQVDARSDIRVNLHIRLRSVQGHLLEIKEAMRLEADGELTFLAYSHHFQDPDDAMIFRYDNAPHYPSVESFPHHKHTSPDAVEESAKPTIPQAIQEALDAINPTNPARGNPH